MFTSFQYKYSWILAT